MSSMPRASAPVGAAVAIGGIPTSIPKNMVDSKIMNFMAGVRSCVS